MAKCFVVHVAYHVDEVKLELLGYFWQKHKVHKMSP